MKVLLDRASWESTHPNISVDGCVFSIPWKTKAVKLAPGCVIHLNDCLSASTIQLQDLISDQDVLFLSLDQTDVVMSVVTDQQMWLRTAAVSTFIPLLKQNVVQVSRWNISVNNAVYMMLSGSARQGECVLKASGGTVVRPSTNWTIFNCNYIPVSDSIHTEWAQDGTAWYINATHVEAVFPFATLLRCRDTVQYKHSFAGTLSLGSEKIWTY